MKPSAFSRTDAYICATIGYGCVRKVVRLWDAKVSQHDFKMHVGRERQLLVSEKVVIGAAGGLAAVYGWPVMLVKDCIELESYVRNTKPPVFEPSSTHVDHLLA